MRRIVGIVAQQEQQLYRLLSDRDVTAPAVFGQIPVTERLYSTCPISHTVFQVHTPVRVLECGHYFTRDGIDEWFERSNRCPLCRGDTGPADHPPSNVVAFVLQGPEDPEAPRAPPIGESDTNVD